VPLPHKMNNMSKSSKKIGIAGAGILGMTMAYRLAQKGYDVTLLDGAPKTGGLAMAWQLDDIVWDKFYHVILMSDGYTRQILKELELDESINWVETKTGFYSDGKLYSMSNTVEFLKFPPLDIISKLRLGFTIFYASRIKNWQKLEKVPVADWLTKLSGKRTFEKMWLPLLKSKLGNEYTKTSAAFIWATIQRMYAARRSGLKKEMFGYVPGGYHTILNSFNKKLQSAGVTVLTNHKVEKIRKSKNGKFSIEFTHQSDKTFDKVIVTTPSSFIPGMCPQLSNEEKSKLSKTQYLGVVCAAILLDKPLSAFYVTNITDDGFPFTGVIEMTALVDSRETGGKHLIYLPKYVMPDDEIFSKKDEAIIELFVKNMLKMHPHISDKNILFSGVARAKKVFALSTLNYSKNVPRTKSSVDGLYIVNSSQITNGTLNVNETIQLAEKAIEQYF